MFNIIYQSRYRRVPLLFTCGFVFCKPSRLNASLPFEEEQLVYYSPDWFYPVTIGEVQKSNLKILSEPKYGAYSTVWPCRDVR
jgi:hypothetical protein